MAMVVLLRVLENFQGDGEFRSKKQTKTERRSNASFGLTYVEVFCEIHLPQCLTSRTSSTGKDGCKGGFGYREIEGRRPMPPARPLMKPNSLISAATKTPSPQRCLIAAASSVSST
jgi:hypothetical protein